MSPHFSSPGLGKTGKDLQAGENTPQERKAIGVSARKYKEKKEQLLRQQYGLAIARTNLAPANWMDDDELLVNVQCSFSHSQLNHAIVSIYTILIMSALSWPTCTYTNTLRRQTEPF
jgi:hypothetical protein